MNEIICGDALSSLRALPDGIVQTCVTSPPYFGLRDYGTAQWEGGSAECDHIARVMHPSKHSTLERHGKDGRSPQLDALPGIPYSQQCAKCGATRIDQQIGLEDTPEAYIARLVEVFREVRRVLRDDGTLWVNIGDSYAGGGRGGQTDKMLTENWHPVYPPGKVPGGYKPKDLIGIPWLLAQALQRPYYTGKIAKEVDRVWLAATIDAEGCICGFTHKRKDDGAIRTGVEITITNSSIALLDNAYRIWPTTRVEHNVHRQGHLGMADTYRWIAHDVDEKSLLVRELYPYLIVKKKQALLAWNFFEMSKDAKHLARTPEAQAIKDKRAWIIHAMSRLNHFEDVDIPSWCKEPPSLYEPGYYLRSDIIWSKPNCMPESVTDRPTKAHEYIFLLSKSSSYYYDAQAIAEPATYAGDIISLGAKSFAKGQAAGARVNPSGNGLKDSYTVSSSRNKRSVWTVSTMPYSEAHFATFPPKLIEPCILAGTSPQACEHCGAPWERVTEREFVPTQNPLYTKGGIKGMDKSNGWGATPRGVTNTTTLDWQPTCTCTCNNNTGSGSCVVLDPFCGAGTVPLVALKYQRQYIGIELNPEYVKLINKRIHTTQPVLWEVGA